MAYLTDQPAGEHLSSDATYKLAIRCINTGAGCVVFIIVQWGHVLAWLAPPEMPAPLLRY